MNDKTLDVKTELLNNVIIERKKESKNKDFTTNTISIRSLVPSYSCKKYISGRTQKSISKLKGNKRYEGKGRR